ncbi:MAG TPA: c-type cytochrome [Candidatus Margulisiibacteriota bacterium]|nr:c-type cytochrome [Candidatus Margulisiibacteriota bacterium]
MKNVLCLALLLTVLVALASGRCVAGGTESTGTPDGRRLYREYCSSCHGISGKGNGEDAALFAAPPRNLREGFLTKYSTDELVRRVREGRPLELALDLPALRVRALEVEELAAYMRRLPGIDWERAAAGEDQYAERCAACHGPGGRPGPTLPAGVRRPRDLSDPKYQSSVSDAELTRAVQHGREGMPALTPRVSDAEARELTVYVRLFSPGFELYASYCAACHGDDGRGNGNLAEEIRRPAVVFDREYFQHMDPEKLRANVWHMVRDEKPMMPHFRVLLTEAQARAIVEYLQRTD